MKAVPAPNRILILASMALGDTVMFMPILHALRTTYPHAKLDIVLEHRLPEKSIAKTGYCNRIHVIDNHLFLLRNLTRGRALFHFVPFLFRTSFRLIRVLTQTAFRYDMVIGHYNSCLPDLAVIALLSGAPVRIGQVRAKKNNSLYRRMYTRQLPFPETKHLLSSNFELLNQIGIPAPATHSSWPLFQEDLCWAKKELKEREIAPNRFVVICPTVGYFKWKQWPLDFFAQLIEKILEATTYHVVLVGANPEETGPFVRSARVTNLTGKTSVDQTAALVSFCARVIAHDSGISHLAAALGKPVLTIFGPTDPSLVGPWGQLGNVVRIPDMACAPCFAADESSKPRQCKERNCLEDLSVQTVFERFMEMDASDGPSR